MNMTDSQNLLAEYLQTGSEDAFRELVARYVDLVYSTALRFDRGVANCLNQRQDRGFNTHFKPEFSLVHRCPLMD